MAYEPESGQTVLFGGAIGVEMKETPLGDTWTYDLSANTWTQLPLSIAPTARAWHAMACDPDTGKIVLFGGGTSRDKVLNDTWMFDTGSRAWTRV